MDEHECVCGHISTSVSFVNSGPSHTIWEEEQYHYNEGNHSATLCAFERKLGRSSRGNHRGGNAISLFHFSSSKEPQKLSKMAAQRLK